MRCPLNRKKKRGKKMKLKHVALVLMTVVVPFFGYSKSKTVSLLFGDVTLDPEDSLTFTLEDMAEDIGGYEVLSEFLPEGVEVTWTGKKFKMPKAGKVKYSKSEGDFIDARDSDNPSGLKLSISKKTGAVKGSFKVYVAKSEKKLKSYTAKVTGIIGGDGLTVTIKNGGAYGASLE